MEENMEKEDQLIKDLIQEGFLKSAPDDFTENVMKSVAGTETQKESVFGDNAFSYGAIVFAAMALAGGIIYFVDPSFYSTNFGVFNDFLKQVLLSFSGIFKASTVLNIDSNSTLLILGVIVIMAMLLLFERLLNRNRRLTNLFV
jgi:hypothetical protein